MAVQPVLAAKDVTVQFGEDVVLDGIDLTIGTGERVCVTGRNGAGKSTLLRVLAGRHTPDGGAIWHDDKAQIAILDQSLLPGSDATVYEAVAVGVAGRGALLTEYRRLAEDLSAPGAAARLEILQQEIERTDGWALDHEIRSVVSRLSLPTDARLAELSGGWRKRISIARSLVGAPNVWILDEPTNHLDIPTVHWLEREMLEFQGTLIFITHDRELMRRVGNVFVDVGLGRVRRYAADFRTFLARREHDDESLAADQKRFDKKLAEEEAWIRGGIKARRARNQGRVRMLESLRTRRLERRQAAKLHLEVDAGSRSGNYVKELSGVSKALGTTPVLRDVDLLIRRGERLGVVGANGVGKSTLIRVLLGELEPDSGQVKTGTRLETAYFDQQRSVLDPDRNVADTIADGREYVTINKRDIHTISYLRSFMFSGDQARGPVRVLSGGEQNRLLLARLFSLPTNMLVLDEPTNDLDVDSLELLEQLLADYSCTVLLVTHDRAFLDNVVDSILVLDGSGSVVQYHGGYTDWLEAGGRFPPEAMPGFSAAPLQTAGKSERQQARETDRESRRAERAAVRELEKVPGRIEALEARVAELNEEMGAAGFYQRSQSEQQVVFDATAEAEMALEALYVRWEELESALGGD